LLIKNNHSAQKIFQNPVANLKSRKMYENLEYKKYIMGCIPCNGYFLIRKFCSNFLLRRKNYKNFEKIPLGAFWGEFWGILGNCLGYFHNFIFFLNLKNYVCKKMS
jgi:hypothetical protein